MSATTKIISKNRICQGEIFYVMPEGETPDADTFYGGRPAVIVSNDMLNEFKGVVTVAFLTRHTREHLPTDVKIMATTVPSWAVCDQLTTVSKRRIGKYIGQCSQIEMENIKQAIAICLTMDIDNLNRKNIESALELWKANLQETSTTDEITEYPIEDFETKDTDEKENKKTIELTKNNTNEKQNDVAIDITVMPEYIKLLAERDVYKSMVEKLLVK